jgi:hypothetical protein
MNMEKPQQNVIGDDLAPYIKREKLLQLLKSTYGEHDFKIRVKLNAI